MEEVLKYFPSLTDKQLRQLEMLGELYPEWNSKINVISRKDIDNLYLHHILHSLAIAKFLSPIPGTRFMDLGTGGGFPGIPLAIVWPECSLHLVDRIGKKIKVAADIAEKIGLENVTLQHGDVGECHQKFDFVVSRAVTRLDDLTKLVKKNISADDKNALPNGLIALKGGDLEGERVSVKGSVIETPLSDWFSEDFFKTKLLVYTPIK